MNIKTFQKIFDEEYQKFRTSAETDKKYIEKFQDEINKPVPTFEEDPIGYILYSYPTLKESLETLLSKNFLDYVTGIYIIAPVPTTFKVILHNNQFFYMIYMGRTWMAKISGKKYYLLNVGERGRAIEAIARLLMMGAPANVEPTQEAASNSTAATPVGGGEGNPFASGTASTETPPAEETAPSAEETSGAAPLTESKKNILLEVGRKHPSVFRLLVKQALLLEGSKLQNTKKVIQRIITSEENQEYGLLPMANDYRIANPNKISQEQFKELLQKLYPNDEINVIPPKTPPNSSSKFNMYMLNTEYGPATVILASGANKGEKYESDFVEKLKQEVGKPLDQIKDKEVYQLFEYLEIDPTTLKPENIKGTGKQDTKRSVNFNEPEDIGTKIADIIIDYNGDDYKISLKDPKGDYIYNGGNLKFIKMNNEGKVYFDEKTFITDNSPTKEIIEVTGINPEKIAEGLNNYVDKTGEPSHWENINTYDGEKIKNLLASSYGYGYYYVRQIKPGELYIKDILEKDDVYNLIGEVEDVKVKYAGPGSKSTEVRITTNSPEGGQVEYQIDMRNASGGLLPAIKVKSINKKKS